MIDLDEVDRAVAKLQWLTPIEKVFARSRLVLFAKGRMPRWERQVQRTGLRSMGYFVVGGAWATIGGPFGLCAGVLAFFHHKPISLVAVEVSCYAIAFSLGSLAIIRLIQGSREGRRYRQGD